MLFVLSKVSQALTICSHHEQGKDHWTKKAKPRGEESFVLNNRSSLRRPQASLKFLHFPLKLRFVHLCVVNTHTMVNRKNYIKWLRINIVNYERHLAQGFKERWQFVPNLMISNISSECLNFHDMRTLSINLSRKLRWSWNSVKSLLYGHWTTGAFFGQKCDDDQNCDTTFVRMNIRLIYIMIQKSVRTSEYWSHSGYSQPNPHSHSHTDRLYPSDQIGLMQWGLMKSNWPENDFMFANQYLSSLNRFHQAVLSCLWERVLCCSG